MKKTLSLIFSFALIALSLAQSSEIKVDNLKPGFQENSFPVVSYKSNPMVEEKINTILQLENLDHLPYKFLQNPFENVVSVKEEDTPSVYFHDYFKHETPRNILSIIINGEATGAYTEGFEIYYNFDVRTGNKMIYSDFIDAGKTQDLTNLLNSKVKAKIRNFLKMIRLNEAEEKNLTDREFYKDQISIYENCLINMDSATLDYYDFYFQNNSIVFVRGRCSNHMMRALDDLNTFYIKLSLEDFKKYLSEDGNNLISGSDKIPAPQFVDGRFYKGFVGGKFPIRVYLSKVYSDGSLDIKYWYDKYKEIIEWNGVVQGADLDLREFENYDQDLKKWIAGAEIKAVVDGDKIIGTWTRVQNNQELSLELQQY